MSAEWMMDEYRRVLYVEFSSGKRQIGHPSCVPRMSARMISGALALPLPTGEIWLRAAFGGDRLSVEDYSCLKSPWRNTMKLGGPEESSGNKAPAHQHLQGQPSHATSVVENVFQTSDFYNHRRRGNFRGTKTLL